MQRPTPPILTGIHRSPNNRFAWDFGHIPSPKRTSMTLVPADPNTGGRHTQEAIPVLCSWCFQPFWPPWQITQGCCSDGCRETQQAYLTDRRTRDQLVEQLKTVDASPEDVEAVLHELRERLADEHAENDRLRGELGKVRII